MDPIKPLTPPQSQIPQQPAINAPSSKPRWWYAVNIVLPILLLIGMVFVFLAVLFISGFGQPSATFFDVWPALIPILLQVWIVCWLIVAMKESKSFSRLAYLLFLIPAVLLVFMIHTHPLFP